MRTKFILDKKTFPARAAIVCLIMAILFRLIGTVGHFDDRHFLIFRMALPALSCLLYILCIILFGRKAFWTSFIPVIVGIVFFIMRILSDDNITSGNLETVHIAICMALYILVAVLYSCTVFGAIKTKFFLVVLFGLAFVYHIVFEDYPAIASKTVAAEAIFMELGVLFIILGLFFACLGLKKQAKASTEKSEGITPPIPGGVAVHSDPEPKETPEEELKEEKIEEIQSEINALNQELKEEQTKE